MLAYTNTSASHGTRSSEYTRRWPRIVGAAMTVAVCGALAACGGTSGSDAATSDSATARDLAMAGTDSAAQPKLQDVPVTPPAPAVEPAPVAAPVPAPPTPPAPAPKAPKRAAAPSAAPSAAPAAKPAATPGATPAPSPGPAKTPPAPTTGTVAAGTSLQFEASAKICSNTAPTGDTFTAPLSQAVSGTNGATIPAGATGTFQVVQSRTAKNSNDSTFLRVRLVSVRFDGNSYSVDAPVQAASTTRVRSATKGTDAKKVIGGAVLGAIAGQIIGKDTKGTVIGAATGAAVGTAAASATADFDTCLNAGAPITVTLDGPVTVKLGGA